ncbi:hypothetical protein Scinn_44420 [Streptomyces virginiae]|uniref:Uncharacterized protein n=1 Tax=Streptomyces virginiae TaxID=1961 RepID=A0ABQ3NQB4_STRVG|nr:hypothetical protein Scinn_44420 [Streptomyces virginiae]
MSGRQSTSTGRAPIRATAPAVAMKVLAGSNHLVAHADPARAQRQFEGVGAVGDPHAVPDPGEVGVLALEGADLRAPDEGGVGEHPVETGP